MNILGLWYKIKTLFNKNIISYPVSDPKPVYIPKWISNKTPYAGRIGHIRRLARTYQWSEIDLQFDIFMISFRRKDVRLNIYYSRMTVATALLHPSRGKTQLFRRNVEFDLLKNIFENPRIHTGRGYHKNGK